MNILILLSFFLQNAYSQERNGLTWGVQNSNGDLINVSCNGLPATVGVGRSPSCDPYVGDTSCAERRPVLCINKSKSISKPIGIEMDQYNQWSGGQVQLTHPIEGYALNSLQAANSLCAEYYGKDWRMAEHHDGWGWGFWAVGKIAKAERFWVHINDQPGNCWDGGKEDRAPVEIESLPKGLLRFM